MRDKLRLGARTVNKRKKIFVFGVFLISLIGIRLALPFVIRNQANKKLAEMDGYKGKIGRVHLALWRGAFAFDDFDLHQNSGDMAVYIQRLEMSVLWPHLFHKAFVGKVSVDKPLLTLVISKPSKAPEKVKEKGKEVEKTVEKKTGKTIPQVITSLIPFRIDRFKITEGVISLKESYEHAAKNEKAPEKAPFLTSLNVTVTNLTNSRKLSDSLVSTGKINTKITGTGNVDMTLRINIMAPQPTFDMALQVQKFDLASLNHLLMWQTGLNFKQGTFAMDLETSAANGEFKGYVKPFIENLKVENAAEKDGLIQKAKKTVINVAAVIFKNDDSKKVATRIPFKGKFSEPRPDIWQAVIELLRNAFIEAIKPGLDLGVHPQKLNEPVS